MYKNYLLKIPKNISVFYSKKHQVIFIKGPLSQKIIKLNTQIELFQNKGILKIKNKFFNDSSVKEQKKIKSYQGTNFSLIKQGILEVSKKLFKKLKINGIGYKVDIIETSLFSLLQLKLGFSHFIYYKIPKNIIIKSYKSNKLIILGHDYKLITSIAAKIRNFKVPEVYKGKGILYVNEIIKLKEGKKV